MLKKMAVAMIAAGFIVPAFSGSFNLDKPISGNDTIGICNHNYILKKQMAHVEANEDGTLQLKLVKEVRTKTPQLKTYDGEFEAQFKSKPYHMHAQGTKKGKTWHGQVEFKNDRGVRVVCSYTYQKNQKDASH